MFMNDSAFDNLLCDALQHANLADYQTVLADQAPIHWSSAYRRQRAKMLENPWKWYQRQTKPVYKKILYRVACLTLCMLLSLGTVMMISPTARAAIVRWVREWYTDHIEYLFTGNDAKADQTDYRPQ